MATPLAFPVKSGLGEYCPNFREMTCFIRFAAVVSSKILDLGLKNSRFKTPKLNREHKFPNFEIYFPYSMPIKKHSDGGPVQPRS